MTKPFRVMPVLRKSVNLGSSIKAPTCGLSVCQDVPAGLS
jgi:hypothetical protein